MGRLAFRREITPQGRTVWAHLQYSSDGTNLGRASFLLRFNTQSHQWGAYTVRGGSVYAWTVTPTGTAVSVVHSGLSQVLEMAHRTVVRIQPRYTLVGIDAEGIRVYLGVSGHHRVQLVAIAAK